MALLTFFLFCTGFAIAYSLNCEDVSGKWQNELRSRMRLTLDHSNRISGEYWTAVETLPGRALFASNITGLFSKQSDGAILAFSVLFGKGFSVATWVGQCMVCDGKEILYMTYILRTNSADNRERWPGIIINQNTFWRIEDETEIASGSLTKNPITYVPVPKGVFELNGKWKSADNEEIEFLVNCTRIIEDDFYCCHLTGKHHTTDLVGRTDGRDHPKLKFTAVTFISTAGKRIRSWTGHIYSAEISPITLETSWLEHEYNPSCTDGRNSVKFGVQNFTRVNPAFENMVEKPETFLDKIRKFFSSMF